MADKKKRPGAGGAGSHNNMGSSNGPRNTPNAKVEQGPAETEHGGCILVCAADIVPRPPDLSDGRPFERRKWGRKPRLSQPVYFQRRQWAVTAYGLECLDRYRPIKIANLGDEWLLHKMAGKPWVDLLDFRLPWEVAVYFIHRDAVIANARRQRRSPPVPHDIVITRGRLS